jgi:hypothetical protein
MATRFITDDQGQRVGVLLDLATYEALLRSRSQDTELLQDLSAAELAALAGSKLTPDVQGRLNELLAKQADGVLSEDEAQVLEKLLEQVDHLNILKARAHYTLQAARARPG